MKIANVNNVVIQMDIPSTVKKGKEKEYIDNVLVAINDILRMSSFDSSPQLITAGIEKADIDITEPENEE